MTKQLKKDQGFTLVELAIVMIIIGLLIGGVLKGQELINNAQISSTIAEMNAFDSAVAGFRDQFRDVPGDMSDGNAQARIPNCAAAPCLADGNDNGRIDETALEDAHAAGDENVAAWVQLFNANYISGVTPGVSNQPETSLGQGFYHIAYHAGGALDAGYGGGNASQGHYLTLVLNAGDAVANAGFLDVSQAARIDRKIDDGVPTTGRVQGDGTDIVAGGTGGVDQYNEANPSDSDMALVVGLSN